MVDLSKYSKCIKYVFTNVFKGNEMGGDERFSSNNTTLHIQHVSPCCSNKLRSR